MIIEEALDGIKKICLDTSPFIYYIENHPYYADVVDKIFQSVESNNITVHASVLALSECLVKPIQNSDVDLQTAYKGLFSLIGLTPVSQIIAEQAAHLRAMNNLKIPDAIHISTALDLQCQVFITNDKSFKRISGIQVVLLDDLELVTSDE